MSMTLEAISEAALALPLEQRERLLEKLHASLFDDVPAEIEEAQVTEIQRRREEYFSGKTQLIPGEQVEREMRELLNEISRVPRRGAR